MTARTLIALSGGLGAGVVTGLIPGLHINTINQVFTRLGGFDSLSNILLILSMSLTHTFLDAIPSIFLGMPEGGSVILLPGHKMLKEGRGREAVRLTLYGSFFSVLMICVSMPVLLVAVFFFFQLAREYTFWILLFFAASNVVFARKRMLTLIVLVSSGILGLAAFNYEDSLFPLLSGLFGVSSLLLSLNQKSKIPEQIESDEDIKAGRMAKLNFFSVISGTFTGTLPGISTAQSSSIALMFLRKKELKDYLVLTGGIDTVNFVISLFVLYLFDRARNGSIIAIREIVNPFMGINLVLFLVVCSLLVASSAFFVGNFLSGVFAKALGNLNYRVISLGIISLVSVLVGFMAGVQGLIILASSTLLGVFTASAGVQRRTMMGCILLPVMSFLY